ncbi:hypothetical protein LTR62_003762 [Meristemomyces frigidus]|uniref:Pre-mRNA-splicing factor n=1 Tax=Meristemomyces frigidus TaxID=1508187 RepID=A0AAN7TK77_9PEZI|nr:hypothetical protein LTR62_003762 [Meristemomyces frigidus]
MSGKILLALGGPKKPNGKPTPTNGVKRPHTALHEDDEDHNDSNNRAHTVSHFDKSAGGAIDERAKPQDNGPLVIAPQANRDWREASQRKRQRKGLPPDARNAGRSVEDAAIREKELDALKPGFGLNVTKREQSTEELATDGYSGSNEAEALYEPPLNMSDTAPVIPKTDDELAMDALLGITTKSELVLPAVSEEQAFERDFQDAPDGPTLDDYDRVPVEQFGAGLLRGMGWVEGQGIGSQKGKKLEKTKVPARRPALLGIGAKEEAAVAQEMGVWGKAAKKGGEIKIYNPVLLRDKQTGELYTEEELKKKKERDERKQYEEEFEKKEREKKDSRRRQDEDKDARGSRKRRDRPEHDSRDRHRRTDRRERDRDRRRDDEGEDEHRRRKEKERRRRDDEDRDRERSQRYDGERDRDKHRHSNRDSRR